MLKAVKDWGALVAVVLAAVAGLLWVGGLRADVTNLKDRMDRLETRVDPIRQLKVGKGDLCLKMLEEWGQVKDQKRQDAMQRQWEATDCSSMVAAATTLANAAQGSNATFQPDSNVSGSSANDREPPQRQ